MTKFFSRLAVLAALVVLFAAPAFAEAPAMQAPPLKTPDPDTLAAAQEFVEVTQSTTVLDKLLPMMSHNFASLILRDNPGKTELVGKIMSQTFDTNVSLHKDDFKTKIATVYADNLSRDDLKKLTEFYKSPAGQAYLKAMPTIMDQTMEQARAWTGQNVHEAMQKLIAELRKNNLNVPKEMERK